MTDVAGKLAKKSTAPANSKQVRLRLVHVGVWSVTKITFLICLAIAIIGVVATFVTMTVISAFGVFDTVNDLITSITGASSIDVSSMFGTMTMTGFAMLGGCVFIVLGTLMGALSAVIYNAIAKMTGGLLVGFANPR